MVSYTDTLHNCQCFQGLWKSWNEVGNKYVCGTNKPQVILGIFVGIFYKLKSALQIAAKLFRVYHCLYCILSLVWSRCVDKNGTDVTVTNQTCETIETSLALKPLMCRIRQAFSKVFYQLLFLCAGEYCKVLHPELVCCVNWTKRGKNIRNWLTILG